MKGNASMLSFKRIIAEIVLTIENTVSWLGVAFWSLLGWLLISGGVLVICLQIYDWLVLGYWAPRPLATTLAWLDLMPDTATWGWRGLAKLVNWVLSTPLSIVLIFTGMPIVYANNWEFEEERKLRDYRRSRINKKD